MRLTLDILRSGRMSKRKSNTGRNDVLEFLKNGYKLNALVAHREFGMIGSTLAFTVFKLRERGWDIETEYKKAPLSGKKYAEYTLSANWRLGSETLKREDIAKTMTQPKVWKLRDFKIDQKVLTKADKVLVIKGINDETPFGGKESLILVDLEADKYMKATLDFVVKKVK